MPTRRSRTQSESSTSSMIADDQSGAPEPLSTLSNGGSSSISELEGDVGESTWLRPCCTPLGCLSNGQVNLTEPDEIEKIICSNENCTVGPYMHKECFTRWEDGLLTYLRSHGRARSWSEKQRRQNLWTKRGYDLAYRACACLCERGHLRKDLHWDPKDITPNDALKGVATDECTKKKNRKKHKDLPTLGNKYAFVANRSKSKAIPANGKDNRVRTNSTSSILSVDQGYSSSSPSNSEIHGSSGNVFFSPPHNGRNIPASIARAAPGHRNPGFHSANNAMFPHAHLPLIPDSDVLEDLCGNVTQFPAFCEPQPLFGAEKVDLETAAAYRMEQTDVLSPLHHMKQFPSPHPQPSQQQVLEMMGNLDLSRRQRCSSWNGVPVQQQSPLAHNMQSPLEKPPLFDFMARQLSMPLPTAPEILKPVLDVRNEPSLLESAPGSDIMNLPMFGHWNPQTPPSKQLERSCCQPQAPTKGDTDLFCQCYPLSKITEQPPLLPFQDFMDNATTMLCKDIDLKKPKVIVIPGESSNNGHKRTCTEICISPMCGTVFHKRYDFKAFQSVLKPSRVNPYHIKMEGEGYGSDDFRNSVLAKLSKAKVSQMNCVTCGKELLIYDHFPLLDGALYLSPLRNEGRMPNDLKIEIENKSAYLYAVCVSCLDGANNLICMMCEGRWRGPFHQLGSLYMYDVFAAAPCCQSRLCCKRCGVAIVDRRLGLKYFSQYSSKSTCPSCGASDYHFVHPASTFRVLGPDKFRFF